MRRATLRKLFLAGLSSSLLLACGNQHAYVAQQQPLTPDYSDNQKTEILKSYSYIDPTHQIDTDLLHEAELYFHANKSKFQNVNVLTVIDFAKWSGTKRFFVVDLKTGSVWATYVAHGSGSDPGTYDQATGYAKYFSNLPKSKMTSLGPYRTTETAESPTHGYVLHLEGLASTNSNAADRAIEVHGAGYVLDKAVKQGRSEGCPALPMEYFKEVIDQVKNGSLIYAGLGKQTFSTIAEK